jgi:hypothetical protein
MILSPRQAVSQNLKAPLQVETLVALAGSILIRPHDGPDRLAVVPGAAHGLEADERRGPLPVVVADVQGERHDAPAALPGNGAAQHPAYVLRRWFCALSPEGDAFASPDPDGKSIALLDPLTGRERARAQGADYPAHISFSADGTSVTCSSKDRVGRVWDAATGHRHRQAAGGQEKGVPAGHMGSALLRYPFGSARREAVNEVGRIPLRVPQRG